jgi:hypothetical protein
MSCTVCGLLVGLKTNPILTATETPYEAGARRGVMGGFALACVVADRRISLDLCPDHQNQLDDARAMLADVLRVRQ